VEIDPIEPPVIWGDTLIAAGGSAQLQVTNNYTWYQWSTGSNAAWVIVTQPGIYAVTVTDQYGCTSWANTVLNLQNSDNDNTPPADTLIYKYALPNSFTPNNDGLNDAFTAFAQGEVSNFALFIYNRWGNKVFESYQINNAWNGMYNNTPCPLGTYAYYGFLTFANGQTHKFQGNVTLLR